MQGYLLQREEMPDNAINSLFSRVSDNISNTINGFYKS